MGEIALGLSRAEVARRSGLLPVDLQRIVDGRVKRSKHLPAIAKTLECDVAWMTTGAGTPPRWYKGSPVAEDDSERKRLLDRVEALQRENADLVQLRRELMESEEQLRATLAALREDLSAVKAALARRASAPLPGPGAPPAGGGSA